PTQIAVHGLDRGDVETACRRRGDEHARAALELACEHDLLQVSTRELARGQLRPATADVVAVDQLRRVLADRAKLEQRAPCDDPRAIRLEHDIRGDREGWRDTGVQPILRDVRNAGLDRRACVAAAQTTPAENDIAAGR